MDYISNTRAGFNMNHHCWVTQCMRRHCAIRFKTLDPICSEQVRTIIGGFVMFSSLRFWTGHHSREKRGISSEP